MKKSFFITIALLAMFLTGNAQISGLNIGYCNGEINTSGTDGFGTQAADAWVSGAIYLPENQVHLYAGNHIDKIHAGLASKLNVDELTVWVRRSLDGENLASATINASTEQKIQKGWNEITFVEPFDISETEGGLYVGYSFHQKSFTYALSVLPKATANGCFVKYGDEEWQDKGNEATLCIEALVYGDQLPRYNLTLNSIEVQPVYAISQGTLDITATVSNIAMVTITGFKAECQIDGYDNILTADIEESIAYGETKTVSFTIEPTMITNETGEPLTINVTLTDLKEGDDEDMSDNTLSATFEVVKNDFTRKVFVEEFTTESCPNCPRVANYIHNALDKEEFADRVISIEHHNAYYTDWLTIPCSGDYLWFFNAGGSTYAPALMYDRYNFDVSTPVSNPSTQADMEGRFRTRLRQPAFVCLNMEGRYVSENELEITISGERSKVDITKNPARITVYLVEDNILARRQAGADGEFIHHNVARGVNGSWGTELDWDGNEYTYTCRFTMRGDYERDELKVIAMIWDYDREDATKCEIANTNIIHASEFGEFDGIKTIETNTMSEETIGTAYTIDGRQVKKENLTKGLYIIDGRKIVVK